MITPKRSMLLLACATFIGSSIYADNNTQPELNQHGIAYMQDVLSKPYFSPDLVLAEKIRNFSLATQWRGFVKTTDKAVFLGLYNLMTGNLRIAKYEKIQNNRDSRRALKQNPFAIELGLYAVKSEEYNHTFDGNTHCTRKGIGARGSVPVGETAARILRATANAADMKPLSIVDLYNTCALSWMHVNSVEDAGLLQDWLNNELMALKINPATVDQLAKPTVIFTAKNDLVLDSFGTSLQADMWARVCNAYNVTTFLDKEIREDLWEAKKELLIARAEAKAQGVDINPSLLEGLFGDFEKESEFFAVNGMIRGVLKGVVKEMAKYGTIAMGVWAGVELGQFIKGKIFKKEPEAPKTQVVTLAPGTVVNLSPETIQKQLETSSSLSIISMYLDENDIDDVDNLTEKNKDELIKNMAQVKKKLAFIEQHKRQKAAAKK